MQFNLSIADISLSINFRDRTLIPLFSRYKKFIVPRNQVPGFYKLQLTTSISHYDKIQRTFVSKKKNCILIRRHDFRATFDIKKRIIDASFLRYSKLTTHYSFDSLLRILYSIILLENSGFLIHACGISSKGKAYVFAGPSNSGKSTLAQLSLSHAKILSDELIAIRMLNGNFYAFSTPFYGEVGSKKANSKHLLSAIFKIKKGKELILKRLNPKDTALLLLQSVFFFERDINSNTNLLNLISKFSIKVPSFHMVFPKSKNFPDKFFKVLHKQIANSYKITQKTSINR